MSITLRDQLSPQKFIELYVRQHWTLREIGERYGVSRQRVHQYKKEIEKKYGRLQRRHLLDITTLKRLLEKGWSYNRIAKHLQVKPQQVAKAIHTYNDLGFVSMKMRRKTASERITKETLYRLYVAERLTDKEIAAKYDVSPSTICTLRKTYNIPTIYEKKRGKLQHA